MRIIFIRHADALLRTEKDFDRELSPQGLNQLREVSKSLEHINLESFEIHVSSSRRTVQTWDILNEILGLHTKSSIADILYNADIAVYHDIISNSTAQNIGFVGHNPAISMIASDLSKSEVQLSTGAWVLLNRSNETSQFTIEAHFRPQDNY